MKANKDLELLNQLHLVIKDMQQIRFLCERAKKFYIEEKDIDEILELAKKHV